jgi:hypothetical protein
MIAKKKTKRKIDGQYLFENGIASDGVAKANEL